MKIAMIGAGAMGGATVEGLIKGQMFKNEDITVSDPSQAVLEKFTKMGVSVTTDNKLAAETADVVCVVVKPWLVERVLTVNPTKPYDETDISNLAFQFLMEMYSRFDKYSKRPDADPIRDKLALSTAIFKLTDEEMDNFAKDIGEVMMKYDAISKESKGKIRSVSMVLSPVDETDES